MTLPAESSTTTPTALEPRAKKHRCQASDDDDSMTSDSMRSASLTTLPAELIMKISCQLDSFSFFALALAWRHFLQCYAQALDPWNPVRQKLQSLCNARQATLDSRYPETSKRTSNANHCDCDVCDGGPRNSDTCEWYWPPRLFNDIASMRFGTENIWDDYDEGKQCARRFVRESVQGNAAEFVALYDYLMLDSYRRHRDKTLYELPIRLDFTQAAKIVARVSMGMAWPRNRPPLCFTLGQKRQEELTVADLTATVKVLDFLPFTELHLRALKCGCADDGAARRRRSELLKKLARSLATGNQELEALTLPLNHCESTPELINAVALGCRKLTLLGTRVPDMDSVEAIVNVIRQVPTLSTLDLRNSDFRDSTKLKLITDAILKAPALKTLSLCHCGINDEGIQHIADMIRQSTTLQEVYFDAISDFGDDGACAFASALRDSPTSSLTRLTLMRSRIGDVGAFALAEALIVNENVGYINLRNNRHIREVGWESFGRLRSARPRFHYRMRAPASQGSYYFSDYTDEESATDYGSDVNEEDEFWRGDVFQIRQRPTEPCQDWFPGACVLDDIDDYEDEMMSYW